MNKKKNVLLLNSDIQSTFYEEFERIRLNIEFSSYENDSKVLLITSPNKKEGKTTIAANIAISLAMNGRKVLLVDGNIKNPMIHQLFKIKNTIGLTNFLIGQKEIFESINQSPLRRLKIMTAGPRPLELETLLKSQVMDYFIRDALSHFDFVIFDSSPVLESNEAKIIGSKCDGTYLIIRNGKTEQSAAINTKKILEISNAKLLGVIFNKKSKVNPLKKAFKVT